MSAMPEKTNLRKVDLDVNENIGRRPNIDHLIKRIVSERKRERKNSFLIMCMVILGLVIASFIFLKN